MSLKTFWKNSMAAFALKNVLVALVVLFVLVWLTLFLVSFYTRHGQNETVPDVRGMYVEEAQNILSKHRLFVKVVDSIYVSGKPLGSVIDQVPAAGSKVKPERDIYLVINSRIEKKIPLPDILETSYRQADAILRSIGMKVQNVEYIPSEYKDLVLVVKYHGTEIQAGTRISDGSALTLVVGKGIGNMIVAIPSVRGTELAEAQETLLAAGFVVGAKEYDVQPYGNEADYVVYRQKPAAGRSAVQGSRINLWLSTDKSLLNKTFDDDEPDEEFF